MLELTYVSFLFLASYFLVTAIERASVFHSAVSMVMWFMLGFASYNIEVVSNATIVAVQTPALFIFGVGMGFVSLIILLLSSFGKLGGRGGESKI